MQGEAAGAAAAETQNENTAAQAAQTWQQQQAQAMLTLQTAFAANPGQLQSQLAAPIAQQTLAKANADAALRLVQIQNQTQVLVNNAQTNLTTAQTRTSVQSQNLQPQQPRSWLVQAGIIALYTVITIAAIVVAVVLITATAGAIAPFLSAAAAAIVPAWLAGAAATTAAFLASYGLTGGVILGIGLFAAGAALSARSRANDGQSTGEIIVGSVLDAVGVTGIAQGEYGIDLTTGTNYDALTGTRHDLTDDERGIRLGIGIVSLAGAYLVGRSAAQAARTGAGRVAATRLPPGETPPNVRPSPVDLPNGAPAAEGELPTSLPGTRATGTPLQEPVPVAEAPAPTRPNVVVEAAEIPPLAPTEPVPAGGQPSAPASSFPTRPGGTGGAYNKSSGQGVYVLRNPRTGQIEYVGRGDAPAEIARYARPGSGKEDLVGEILFNNNLPADQARSLEQELMQMLGGPRSVNPSTTLRNRVQGIAEGNEDFLHLEFAADDELVIEALRRAGILGR